MSKTIKSPVDEFPGKITLPDFLTMPQVLLYERGISESLVLIEQEANPSEIDSVILPAICEIVEEWDIGGDYWPDEAIGPGNFPGSPRIPSSNFLGWVMQEVREIYNPSIPKE